MDAFISYRREGGIEFAARLHDRLRSLHYLSFLDIENMESGTFDTQLYRQIESCPNYILILSPNGLDRCQNEGDWLRKEIAHALKLQKNIVLILLPGFDFPEVLPEDIKNIKTYQGVQYFNWNFPQTVEKVISYLKDDKGNSLEQSKKKRDNNNYYSSVGISPKEHKRIDDEMHVSSLIEKSFLLKAIENRENLVAFASSIYGPKMTYEYLSQPAFKKAYIALADSSQREEVESLFIPNDNYACYDPVSTSEQLDELLSKIELEHHLTGFDFIYLNLALMDADDPLQRLKVVRNHLNNNGVIFIREIDDGFVSAYPDTHGDFAKAISTINDDKYAGNRHIGREVFTLLKMLGANEIHRCPNLLTTVDMSQRNKERLFNAWFGYEIDEFKSLIEEEPDNLLYKSDLKWFEDHLPDMEREFLRDDFFFSAGFVYYYATFSEDD